MPLPDDVYARLLRLRTDLRRFELWSAEQARAAGLTPMQHQLLLAIRGHDDERGPTVGDVANYLLLRHHSAGGLIQRAESAGLVLRVRDNRDQRVTRLQLTNFGTKRLEALTSMHMKEVERLSLAQIDPVVPAPPRPRSKSSPNSDAPTSRRKKS